MGSTTDNLETWSDLHRYAIDRFNEPPGQELEQQIIAIYRNRPAAVEAAINRVADRLDAGKIRSPWPVVRLELQAEADREATRPQNNDLVRLVELAEKWITNAGLYLPTPAEVLDALVGPHGPLKTWAGDRALEQRLVDHWTSQQPRAEHTHAEMLDRAKRHVEARKPKPDTPQPASDDIDWAA